MLLPCSLMGSQTTITLLNVPLEGICTSFCWSMAHASGTPSGCSFNCFILLPNHSINMVGYTALGCFFLSYMAGRGLLFQVVFHQVTWSPLILWWLFILEILVCYQFGECTCTWFAECFVAQSHVYPGFTCKVSTPAHTVQLYKGDCTI